MPSWKTWFNLQRPSKSFHDCWSVGHFRCYHKMQWMDKTRFRHQVGFVVHPCFAEFAGANFCPSTAFGLINHINLNRFHHKIWQFGKPTRQQGVLGVRWFGHSLKSVPTSRQYSHPEPTMDYPQETNKKTKMGYHPLASGQKPIFKGSLRVQVPANTDVLVPARKVEENKKSKKTRTTPTDAGGLAGALRKTPPGLAGPGSS